MDSSSNALLTLIFALASGIFLIVLAHYFRISMIVPLLIGGVILGPNVLGIINPEKGLGDGLKTIISLAIAVILFEGGLSLKLSGLKQAPKAIKNLLSIGVFVTWFFISLTVYFIFEFSLSMSLLAGSLVVVTGPTVVQPLIRRIRLNERLQNILSWEAILIDPIGVFIALLCFEWVIIGSSDSVATFFGINLPAQVSPFITFFIRAFTGITVGLLGGYCLDKVLRKSIVPQELLNIFVLSFALLVFGICELVEHETGILAVTISGFWLAYKSPPNLKQIKKFKLELTDMAIGILFVLLAANLNIENFMALGTKGVIAVFIVVFVVRPISIFLSTYKTDLTLNEKYFLSWMAPRGIVAASMAAIVTIYLSERNLPNTEFFESFTYAIIGTTVLLQGFLSGKVASLLNVKSPDQNGWLIVGINTLSVEIAKFIRKLGIAVTMIDTNAFNVNIAKEKGFDAIHSDALKISEMDSKFFARVGNVLALTDNKDLNVRICYAWNEVVPRHKLFRWQPGYIEVEQESFGNVVLSELPKPSNVSDELDNEYSNVILQTVDQKKEEKDSFTKIIQFSNNKFSFDQANSNTLTNGIHLLLKRNNFYLARIIHENLIETISPKNYEDMLEILMQHISRVIPIIPYEQTRKDLFKRELRTPTIVGNGVAIPHVYCPDLTKSICMVAKLSEPIVVGENGEKINIAFFLLSPPENPKMHLKILADIAKIVSNEDALAGIKIAEKNSDIMKALNSIKG